VKRSVLCLLCIQLSISAFAHDTWLIPDRFSILPGATVTFDLTSGMAFPTLDVGPKRERVEAARCRLAGKTFDLTEFLAEPKALRIKSTVAEAGIATVWVKLPPRSIELKPEEVQHYFEEINPPQSVRDQWAAAKEPKRFREVYTKHPKTFLLVGEPKKDRSWAEPVGMFLEIVPAKDPTALRAGDDFPVLVLKDGKPLADFSLGIVAEGDEKGANGKTDAAGRVTFKLHKPGRWLLRGTDLRKATKQDIDWESDFTTLTVEVER
jgi:uncharacterized GH25 family protein